MSGPALGPTNSPIQDITVRLSSRLKRPEREFDYSHPTSAEMNEWICTSAPSICLGSVDNDEFTFTIGLAAL